MQALELLGQFPVGEASALGIISAYLLWLRGQRSMDEQRNAVRKNLSGKSFSIGPDEYLVKQVDYVKEKMEISYRIRKYIPILRELSGVSKLTIISRGAPSRPYVWAEDDTGETFEEYLSEVASEEFPRVDVIQPDFDAKEFREVSSIRIEIESIQPDRISQVVEEIPQFHEYYFNNYPGDGRFRKAY